MCSSSLVVIVVSALIVLGGCVSSEGALDANCASPKLSWQIGEFGALGSLGRLAGTRSDEAFEGTIESISFGADRQQRALVVLPPPAVGTKDAVIFFVHGGGWERGTPELYRFIGMFFAELGYPTILGGYRLTPDFAFPAQIEDTRDSLRAGVDRLSELGIAADRIIIGGHSAGAQLAALLTFDPKYSSEWASQISGFISLSGPLDFSVCQYRSLRKLMAPYVGHLTDPEVASPARYVGTEIAIPVLAIHGENDPVVSLPNSEAFVDKVWRNTGSQVELYVAPERFHSDTLFLFLEESPERVILLEWLSNYQAD